MGIPSAYTLQNVISHLRSEEGKRLQSSIVRGKGVPLEGEGGFETVLFSSTKFSGNKGKNPDSKDRGIACTWCGFSGHREKECRKKSSGESKRERPRAGTSSAPRTTSSAPRTTAAASKRGGLCWICKRPGHFKGLAQTELPPWCLRMSLSPASRVGAVQRSLRFLLGP